MVLMLGSARRRKVDHMQTHDMRKRSARRRALYRQIHRHPKPAHVRSGGIDDDAAIVVAAPETGGGEISETMATPESRLRTVRKLRIFQRFSTWLSNWKETKR